MHKLKTTACRFERDVVCQVIIEDGHLHVVLGCLSFLRGTRPHVLFRLPPLVCLIGLILHIFYAQPGAMVSGMHFGMRVDFCHSPSTSASVHEVDIPHTYPTLDAGDTPPLMKFLASSRSFIHTSSSRASSTSRISRSRSTLIPRQWSSSRWIFSTLSLPLRTAYRSHKSWDLDLLRFTLPSPVLVIKKKCRSGVDAQANRARLCPSLWRTPELPSALMLHGSQRAVLPQWSGATALLLRPGFDQARSMQDHASTDLLP